KMVRPYKVKGQKRKKKPEKFDKGDEESEDVVPPKKIRTEDLVIDENDKLETDADEMPGVPIIPSVNPSDKHHGDIIFILEKASLEIAKVGKSYHLLSSDEHANYLAKNKRNPAEYRPDIAFQTILTILDSRLNKSGRLKALYVKTLQGLLLEIKPYARMPRTYKRFSGLMVQLLQKLHITAAGKGEKLCRVIKSPVDQYLPANCRKIGLSHSSGKLVDMYSFVGTISNESDLVFVVGAMAHGKIDEKQVEEFISISEYPLSAAYCVSIITTALEKKLKIL
ncbi:hypothetical protein M569_09552, partial [Genlisea aurea]